jgi:helix-turn-helix protein
VVQDSSWDTARLSVEPESLVVTLKGGGLVELELDEISGIDTEERTVNDDKRTVIEVSHAEGETNVETHLTGASQTCIFIQAFLREGERRSETNVDLDSSEEEVLMALYSGVSPFSIPEFIDHEVEAVEETFEKFIELDIVDEVRQRREVTLNSRGRAIASDAIDDQ